MTTNLLGLLIIMISFLLFRVGLRYKDSGYGARLTNIRLIGAAALLFIGGIALVFTSKSMCEIFGVFC